MGTCCCKNPCTCGCSPPTNSASGGGGSSGGGDTPVNPDGTTCTDPGIAQCGIPLVVSPDDFCTKRTRQWRGRDGEGDPIVDPNQPFVNAFFTQNEDGTACFTDQPCVKLPELEVFQYGAFADSMIIRKDGCEFDGVGEPGVPGVWYWNGTNARFMPPGEIGIEPAPTCATLGANLVLTQGITNYTATISEGIEKLAVNLTVNVGAYSMVVTAIIDANAGIISLKLVTALSVTFVNIPAGTSVCPVGFDLTNAPFPVITPDEMQLAPKVVLQLPSGLLRRMSDPDPSLGSAELQYDFPTGGLKWVSSNDAFNRVFAYTGSVQFITVPSWASKMKAYVWGGGGCSEGGAVGGAGGYTWGEINVTPGDVYSIIVGGGGSTLAGVHPYGFGGAASTPVAHNLGGGGLSGIFTGNGSISATDYGRGVFIAGGGGAGSTTTPNVNIIHGGPGNNATSGTMSDMSGRDGYGTQNSGGSGGGGGFRGGDQNGLAAYGGSGKLDGSALQGSVMFTIPGDVNPPQTTQQYYRTGVGIGGGFATGPLPGGPGLVAIEFN